MSWRILQVGIESLQAVILEEETSRKSVKVDTVLENSLKAQTIQFFIEDLGKFKGFIKSPNRLTLEKLKLREKKRD